MDYFHHGQNDTSYRNLYHDSEPPLRQTNQFATAALVMGVITVITAIMCTVFLPFLFAGLALIFAVLSKGKDSSMNTNARTGIVTSFIGLALNIVIIAGSFYLVFTVPEYKDQLNQVYEQLYGESFDSVWNEAIEELQE